MTTGQFEQSHTRKGCCLFHYLCPPSHGTLSAAICHDKILELLLRSTTVVKLGKLDPYKIALDVKSSLIENKGKKYSAPSIIRTRTSTISQHFTSVQARMYTLISNLDNSDNWGCLILGKKNLKKNRGSKLCVRIEYRRRWNFCWRQIFVGSLTHEI